MGLQVAALAILRLYFNVHSTSAPERSPPRWRLGRFAEDILNRIYQQIETKHILSRSVAN